MGYDDGDEDAGGGDGCGGDFVWRGVGDKAKGLTSPPSDAVHIDIASNFIPRKRGFQ